MSRGKLSTAALCTCRDDGGLCRTCRAIRARQAAHPCIICGRPCVAGQRDADGNAAHYCCQERAQ